MAEVVDSIVANLELRYQQYVDGYAKVTAARDRDTKSLQSNTAAHKANDAALAAGKAGRSGASDPELAAARRVRASKTATDAEKADAKAAADAVKKAARDKAAAERVAAKAAADAVKAAEREKQAALKATQLEQEKAARVAAAKAEAERAAAAAATAATEREAAARARLAAVVDRAVARSGPLPQALGGRVGSTVPREATGQRGIPSAILNGAQPDIAAEAEVDHLLADQAILRGRLGALEGAEKRAVQDRLADIRLESALRRAGIDQETIILRLEERRSLVAAGRADIERRQAAKGVKQFAEGAGLGRSFGSTATVAGIATAVGVGVGVQVIQSAVEYGKALDNLSKQLGITVEDLQAYEKIARDTGVSTEQLTSAFGQFASNLGRAQQGSEEQSKVFAALGVDIKNFKSAGDALPTVIDRISQLQDPLQRAAIETRLFGEEGRRLDPLLSGGAAAVSSLTRSLQETGRALSAREIRELDETARKLNEVKNQLQVDFARIVAGNADSIERLAQSFGRLAEGTLSFLSSKPEQALAVLGALAGLKFGGPVGAIVGGAVGYQAGVQANAPAYSGGVRFGKDGKVTYVGPDGKPTAAPGPSRPIYMRGADGKPILQGGAGKPLLLEGFANTPPVQLGRVNPGLIRTLGAPKGPKGKSAEQTEREAEQRTRQFNDQLASATSEYLRAQQQMTANVERRAEIEAQLLETAYQARVADIESQRKRNVLAGADEKLENARAAELVAADKKARDANLAAIEQDKRLDKERALTAATDSLLDVQNTLLSVQAGLATTAKDRRAALLAIVDNEQARETNRLAGIINSSKPGDPAATQALVDFQSVQTRFDAQRRGVVDQTLSPLDQYKKDLHSAADDTTAAIQGIKVNALQNLEDSLTRSISKVLGLKGAFGDLFGSVLADIARLELKKGILKLLDGGSSDGAGGGGLGGLVAGIGKFFAGTRASGGNVVGGGTYLVGEHGPEPVTFGQSGRVYPNGAVPGIAAPRQNVVVVQPIHADFSGARTDEQTMRQFMDYADQRSEQAYREAVGAAGAQVPSVLGQYTTLKR